MAGIYIHIPFCKQACSYCNFHFSTKLANKEELLKAISAELLMRKNYLSNEHISSIYFGGGTPSLLHVDELKRILETIDKEFSVEENAEISFEANPDDLSKEKLGELRGTAINRLSIGIQSFFDKDLQFMNRAHSADEAKKSILNAQDVGFEQLTIDLIFGSPSSTDQMWQENLGLFFEFNIPHLSAYSLTVEEKTALAHRLKKESELQIDDAQNYHHYQMLQKAIKEAGYEQYELSNYCRNQLYSRHNTAYWKREKYLGLGPSAHSFDGSSRQWNMSNNLQYIKAINRQEPFFEREILSEKDQYHEYLITSLRTKWGISFDNLSAYFSKEINDHFKKQLKQLDQSKIILDKEGLKISSSMLFSSDEIVRQLMFN